MNLTNHRARFFDEYGKSIRVLRFIHGYKTENKYPPTIREVGEGCGISSTSVVNYYVTKLIELGCLEKPQLSLNGHKKARFLQLTETGLNNIGFETAVCKECGSLYIVGKHHNKEEL
jgi:SOS-response transcriptional repressor LexA